MDAPKSSLGRIAFALFIASAGSLLGMWLMFFLIILTFGWFTDLEAFGAGKHAIISYILSCVIMFFGALHEME